MLCSLKTGLLEGEEKITNVTIICRKDCKDVPGNHRPGSLSSIETHWESVNKNVISQDVQKVIQLPQREVTSHKNYSIPAQSKSFFTDVLIKASKDIKK